MKNLCRPSGGFTLVEIMVVVVIIGMLAALAIPAFYASRQSSRQRTITNNLRQLAAASEEYMLEQGTSQAQFSDLVGTQSQYYLRGVQTVCQEDYVHQAFPITNSTSQISVDSSVITVTFNL